MKKAIVGSGWGGGGGGHEDSDTLFSKEQLQVIEIISEGEIEGLVPGLSGTDASKAESIFINDIPLQGTDGLRNFKDVVWDQRTGTPTQTHFSQFAEVATPLDPIGLEVKFDTPRSFSVSDSDVDKIRILIKFPALQKQDKGNIVATEVQYKIGVSKNDNSGITWGEIEKVSGKSSSLYVNYHVVDLKEAGLKPSATGWVVTVKRITPDATTSSVTDKFYLDSAVTVKNTKLNYPNTALVYLGIDPKSITSAPKRSYRVRGLKIQVPSNYNFDANTGVATYGDTWNGSLVSKYSNNPAWILYDVLTKNRYGLGIDPSRIDIGELYRIGQHCDERVPTGFGNATEARFAINTTINSRADAYKLISEISSVFRGMTYWSANYVGFTQDVAKKPSMIFNQSNVIDGEFSYVSSARKDRHNVVLVTWNDPNNNYKQTIEYVDDQKLIEAFNGEIKKLEIIAFGCTSRGQAHRAGKWVLLTESYESNSITFKVGMDSALLLPGEIVEIHDSFRAGKRLGGRIKSRGASGFTIEPDVPVTLTESGAKILVRVSEGKIRNLGDSSVYNSTSAQAFNPSTHTQIIECDIQDGPGTHSVLHLSGPLPPIESDAMFLINEPNLKAIQARVVSVSQSDATTFTVNALEYQAGKFATIDNGTTFRPNVTVDLSDFMSSPSDMTFVESYKFTSPGVLSTSVNVSWLGRSPNWNCQYRISDGIPDPANPGHLKYKDDTVVGNWVSFDTTKQVFDVKDVLPNHIIDVELFGVNHKTGMRTKTLYGSHDVKSKLDKPNPPTSLLVVGDFRRINLSWTPPEDLDIEGYNIYRVPPTSLNGPPPTWGDISHVPYAKVKNVTTWTDTNIDLKPGLVKRYYWVVARDLFGNLSDPNADVGTEGTSLYQSAYFDDLYDAAVTDIKNSDLYKDIAKGVTTSIWKDNAASLFDGQVEDQARVNALMDKLQLQALTLLGVADAVTGLTIANGTKIENIESGTRRIDLVAVSDGINSASSLNLQKVTLTNTEAVAEKVSDVVATMNNHTARVSDLYTVKATNEDALIQAIQAMEARMEYNNGQLTALIRSEAQTRVDSLGALATEVHTLKAAYESTAGTFGSGIIDANAAYVSLQGTQAAALSGLASQWGNDISSSIAELKSTGIGYCERGGEIITPSSVCVIGGVKQQGIITETACTAAGGQWVADPAAPATTKEVCEIHGGIWKPFTFAQIKQQLTSSIKDSNGNPQSVTLEEKLQTLDNQIQGSDGYKGLNGQYTLKIDKVINVNGQEEKYVAGFGIATSNPDASDGTRSKFLVVADSFGIAPGLDFETTDSKFPFLIKNGKTIINTALINQAAITSLMLEDTAVMVPNFQKWEGLNVVGSYQGTMTAGTPISTAYGQSFTSSTIQVPPAILGMVNKNNKLLVIASLIQGYGHGAAGSTFDVFVEAVGSSAGPYVLHAKRVAGFGTDLTSVGSIFGVADVPPGASCRVRMDWGGVGNPGDPNAPRVTLLEISLLAILVKNTGNADGINY